MKEGQREGGWEEGNSERGGRELPWHEERGDR